MSKKTPSNRTPSNSRRPKGKKAAPASRGGKGQAAPESGRNKPKPAAPRRQVVDTGDGSDVARAKPRQLALAATASPDIEPRSVLDAVDGARSDLKFKTHEAVFRQGDPADAVFYLNSGRVQLTALSGQGKEGIIALFGPGSFFGEASLTGQPLRLASAIATMPSSIVRIEKEGMLRLLSKHADFSDKFMAFLLQRTIQVEADLVDQLFNSSEKRLARLLLLLANFNNDGELRPIVPKISQDVLAARVGTTRSRINRFMNKFRRLGLIEYNGEVRVHTALLNVIIHD